MPVPLTVPKLGNTVEEVTIVEWLVADGATVEAGQELLEIETDKAIFAVEATAVGNHTYRAIQGRRYRAGLASCRHYRHG